MATGGIRGLRKVQLGKEATKGTSVPATELLLAEAEVRANFPLYRNQHPFGIMGEFGGPTKTLAKDVDIGLKMNGVSYEQLTWLLNASLDVPIDGGAAVPPPYHHVYASGIGAGAALIETGPTLPDSLTLEGIWTDGTDPEEVEIPYCMVRSLTLSGDQNGELQVSADLFGRDIVDAPVTALALPTNLEPIVVADGIFYINTTMALAAPAIALGTWAAPAAGSWAGKIISFNLEVATGLMPFHGVRGALTFDRHQEIGNKNFRLTVRALQDAAASNSPAAERVAAAAGTMRFVTLNFVGSGNKKFRFAGACKHEQGDFLTIGEQDGLDVVEMSFIGHYDPTAGTLGRMQFAVANDEAAAP